MGDQPDIIFQSLFPEKNQFDQLKPNDNQHCFSNLL